jgi:hypothetical protein
MEPSATTSSSAPVLPGSDDLVVTTVVVLATGPVAAVAWLGDGPIGGGATLCTVVAVLGLAALLRAAVGAVAARAGGAGLARAIARADGAARPSPR